MKFTPRGGRISVVLERVNSHGLGLSIVKNLVELHGGSVRVKSPGANQGSTFVVALPVSHVRPEGDRPASTMIPRSLEAIELPRLHLAKPIETRELVTGIASLLHLSR